MFDKWRKEIRCLGVLTFFKQALAGFLMNPPRQRVLHHCTAINIKGASYRLKERKDFMRRKQQIVNTLFEQGSS